MKSEVCVRWKYCDRRNDYGNLQALAYAVSPLVSGVIGMPGSTAMIVAIIMVRVGLDKLCNCPGT